MTEADKSPESAPEVEVTETLIVEEIDGDDWVDDPSGPSLLATMLSEAAGTFILVFMGVGTALYAGAIGAGTLAVAFGFALGVIIAALIFGGISGAHLNPAVTFGLWVAGRFPGRDVAPYWIAQLLGATVAGMILFVTADSHPVNTSAEATRTFVSAGANGYGDHSPVGFGWGAGLIIEVIIAALLVGVVLAVTSVFAKDGAVAAPFAIGLTVGFLVLVAVPFTNGALNPARATGIAVWSDIWALQQVWLFWLAPLVGAAIAGLLYRVLGPTEDLIAVERIEETVIVTEG
ncbi:aquaporin [Demequina sp. B12]|uniref:aquaporin n=1 Tax=Demequina sp. B12 TaxID=2992757 RepID=UPI00237C3170|nr:aquaporin [Demequina sp. B12]MDE0572523.1 aquaporin [Demequina sp. B12]